MDIEHKVFPCGQFKAAEETQGTAEMIVSVFSNLDAGGDRVMPGFFAESLETRRTAEGYPKAKGVWGHDWYTPIAKTLEARELLPGDPLLPESLKDLGGLYVKGQFNLDTQRGREAFSDLRFGTIDEFSIGYSVQQEEYDRSTGERRLIKGDLWEWSPVLVGMNNATALLGTKRSGLPYADEGDTALAAVKGFAERSRSLADTRAKEGRTLSSANRTRLATLKESLASVIADLDELLAATAPEKSVDVMALFAAYQRTLATLNGVATN